jgi:hypothetical protein
MLGLALCLSGTRLAGQDTAGQDNTAVLTLHVATNLVRIPVLVLTPAHERLPAPIASNRFTIQFGDEPSFRPKYVRHEGDDPINLAFVVDARLPQENLLPKLDEAIANLAPSYLRAGDRISIYAIDCAKMTAVEDVPADRLQLKSAVDVALSSWTERQRLRNKTPCSSNTHLWDGLEYVTKRLSTQSGWRAIVALTNGDDRKSKRSPYELVLAAQTSQVTILGLDPNQEDHHGMLIEDSRVVQLAKVCELSGGLRLDLYESNVAKRMQ